MRPALVTLTKRITMEGMRRYSGEGNIHSDDKAAADQGLGGALVQGGQLAAYLSDMMVKSLGVGFLTAGSISVAFIQPVRPGDTVTTGGSFVGETATPGGWRLEYDIWLENQHGEKCTVGKASGLA